MNRPGFPILFSPTRSHRYTLWREWTFGSGYAMFIGLNPSTADETQDDPTIRRCIGFAQAWGYQALCMTNLFAFRATDPRDMRREPDPIGPDNNLWLRKCAEGAGVIVAAWGNHGTHMDRAEEILTRFRVVDIKLHCLRMTGKGQPEHPLYLPGSLKPIPMEVS